MDLRRWLFIILFMSILQLCLNVDQNILVIKNMAILDTFLEHLTHLKRYTYFCFASKTDFHAIEFVKCFLRCIFKTQLPIFSNINRFSVDIPLQTSVTFFYMFTLRWKPSLQWMTTGTTFSLPASSLNGSSACYDMTSLQVTRHILNQKQHTNFISLGSRHCLLVI